jgi:hypothetical protein
MIRRTIAIALVLAACVPPHSAAVLAQADRAYDELQSRYRAASRDAVSWSASPAEAWDMTGDVLDDYGPAWWSLRAVYEARDPLPPFCAAIPVWAERGVHVDDLGLCDWKRPCWTRPSE